MAKDKKSGKNKSKSVSESNLATPWAEEKITRIKAILEKENKAIIPPKDRKAALLSIQYRMEYYLFTNNSAITRIRPLEEFLAAFLQTLQIPFKVFALAIDSTDANLKKYLVGQRRFTLDLAMKFGAFFQVPPELWMNIQAKNEVLRLQSDPEIREKMAGYHYEQVLLARK